MESWLTVTTHSPFEMMYRALPSEYYDIITWSGGVNLVSILLTIGLISSSSYALIFDLLGLMSLFIAIFLIAVLKGRFFLTVLVKMWMATFSFRLGLSRSRNFLS